MPDNSLVMDAAEVTQVREGGALKPEYRQRRKKNATIQTEEQKMRREEQ